MAELKLGAPARFETDIGPVIDSEAQEALASYIASKEGRILFQAPLPPDCPRGTFIAPTLIEISSVSELKHEVFGPVLHVMRFERAGLPRLIEDINATGYGLTLGIHSRIDETIDFIAARAQAGNIYVNRNMIGAVVGVQPFGGEGLSGTGPKARRAAHPSSPAPRRASATAYGRARSGCARCLTRTRGLDRGGRRRPP